MTAPDLPRSPAARTGAADPQYLVDGSSAVIDQDTSWPEHAHPTHELLWNERGASSATVGSRTWTISRSTGLWVPAGVRHSGWTPAGTWLRSALLDVDRVPSIADEPVGVDITPLLRLLLDRLAGDLAPASRVATEALVLDVLAPAPRQLLLRVPGSPLLAPVVQAVLADPADPTTLTGWSVRLGVSTRTLTRAFRAETGLGFTAWVATARAQHAAALLARGDDLEEVATAVGFASPSAFGAAFRRVTGTSPGRFRAR